MQDLFYEESSKVRNEKSATIKYNVLKCLSILSYALLIIWFLMVFNFFEFGKGNIVINIILALIPVIIFFLSGFFIGKIKNKFYVDYDYTFISGSIRFSKVIKNANRKPIIKFDSKDIEKIGKISSKTFEKYLLIPGIKRFILTSNDLPAEGKDFFYIVANVTTGKTIFVLECTELFMVNVLKFTNKQVVEEDYKWFI